MARAYKLRAVFLHSILLPSTAFVGGCGGTAALAPAPVEIPGAASPAAADTKPGVRRARAAQPAGGINGSTHLKGDPTHSTDLTDWPGLTP